MSLRDMRLYPLSHRSGFRFLPTFGKLKHGGSDIVEILDKLRILSLEAGAWTGKPTADDLLHPALN